MRKRYLLILLVIAFISISCASASDFDNVFRLMNELKKEAKMIEGSVMLKS